MVTHKEFSAWITVGGERLHEYDQKIHEQGRTARCYIASEAGKNFAVNWFDLGSGTSTAAYIVCDGFLSSGRYINGYGHQSRSGVRTGQFSERPFQFADIPNTTSRNISNVPTGQAVGTIILKIMHVQRTAGRNANKLQPLPSPISPEWTEKTGGHCVTFGKDEYPVPQQSPFTWSSKALDENNPHSHVKFVFKYRPLAWLQKRGIAPMGEQPKPEQVKIPMTFMPPADLLPTFPVEVAASLSLSVKRTSDISTFVARGMRRSSDQAKLDPIDGPTPPSKKQRTPSNQYSPPVPPSTTFIVPAASFQLYPPESQNAARKEREAKGRVASSSAAGQQQPGPSFQTFSCQPSYAQSSSSSNPSPTNSSLALGSSPTEPTSNGPSPASSTLSAEGGRGGNIVGNGLNNRNGRSATDGPATLILRKASGETTSATRKRDKGKARATPAQPLTSKLPSLRPNFALDLGLGVPRCRGPVIGYGSQPIPHIPTRAETSMPPPPPKSRSVSATSIASTSSLFSDPGGNDYFGSDGLIRMETEKNGQTA